MMTNRFDSVLSRNRKQRVRDLALAAFLPAFVLFTGMSVGAQLSALSGAPQPAAVAAERAAAEKAKLALDESELETAPHGA